ncbi:hypothetical protein OSG_eHP25_00105 [environmental Halophage eHP-25]|nr:hypothetical protein OSG_eHP25_00105 [environmental Halophage eHP-25]
MNYAITTDLIPQDSKPTPGEIGKIHYKLKNRVEVDPQEFLNLVAEKGYTWSPGLFDGKRADENWQKQNILALDFDSGITPPEVIKRFEDLGITPNVIYSTFSDSQEHRKFRLVLFLDRAITDEPTRDFLQRGLLEITPEADEACKDAARLYFGGMDGFVHSEDPINVRELKRAIEVSKVTNRDGRTRSLVDNPEEKFNFGDSHPPVKNGESCGLLCNSNKKPRESPKTEGGRGSDYKDYLRNLKKNKSDVDWERLRERVQIFDDFMDGVWLHHPKIIGLATNLYWIRGGQKLMRETMRKYNRENETGYTDNNFNTVRTIRKYEYYPQRLDSFSPYEEDYRTMIEALNFERGRIKLVEDRPEQISLSEAETSFDIQFGEILDGKDTKVHLVKTPTALGKTQALTDKEGITIAAPTHSLKEEVAERMDVKHSSTPELPEFDSNPLQEKIDTLYKVGLGEKVTGLLRAVAKGEVRSATQMDQVRASEYRSELRRTYRSEHTVLTTHARAMHTDFFNHDTLVFDEDPLDQILEVGEVEMNDFYKLKDSLQTDISWEEESSPSNPIDKVLNWRNSVTQGTYVETPLFQMSSSDLDSLEDKILKSNVSSNVYDFLNSDYCMIDPEDGSKIRYVVKRDIPEDKKIVILSATAPVSVYKELFGDRLEVTEIDNVEREGDIIQHTQKSYSRSSLNQSIDEVNEKTEDLPVITFKSFKNEIEDSVDDIHFGNTEGYDSLKGEDLAVVGTPHVHPSKYALITMALGEKIKTGDMNPTFKAIEYNGYKFKFNSFTKNDVLRDIQLDLIKSELKQAVGRARTLREDCEVHLYSNLPLEITSEFRWNE